MIEKFYVDAAIKLRGDIDRIHYGTLDWKKYLLSLCVRDDLDKEVFGEELSSVQDKIENYKTGDVEKLIDLFSTIVSGTLVNGVTTSDKVYSDKKYRVLLEQKRKEFGDKGIEDASQDFSKLYQSLNKIFLKDYYQLVKNYRFGQNSENFAGVEDTLDKFVDGELDLPAQTSLYKELIKRISRERVFLDKYEKMYDGILLALNRVPSTNEMSSYIMKNFKELDNESVESLKGYFPDDVTEIAQNIASQYAKETYVTNSIPEKEVKELVVKGNISNIAKEACKQYEEMFASQEVNREMLNEFFKGISQFVREYGSNEDGGLTVVKFEESEKNNRGLLRQIVSFAQEKKTNIEKVVTADISQPEEGAKTLSEYIANDKIKDYNPSEGKARDVKEVSGEPDGYAFKNMMYERQGVADRLVRQKIADANKNVMERYAEYQASRKIKVNSPSKKFAISQPESPEIDQQILDYVLQKVGKDNVKPTEIVEDSFMSSHKRPLITAVANSKLSDAEVVEEISKITNANEMETN